MKTDKILHFALACVICLLACHAQGIVLGIILTVCLCIGKELWDLHIMRNSFSIPDLIAGIIGTGAGAVIYIILRLVING